MVGRETEDTQYDIVKGRTKNSGDAFNVDTPAAIIFVCTIEQITDEFEPHGFRYRHSRNIVGDDETRDEKPTAFKG